jgi:hypothetical protein
LAPARYGRIRSGRSAQGGSRAETSATRRADHLSRRKASLHLSSSAYSVLAAPPPGTSGGGVAALGASTLSTLESFVQLPGGTHFSWGLASALYPNAGNASPQSTDNAARAAKPAAPVEDPARAAAREFCDALTMLAYNAAYLAHTQGVRIDVGMAAGSSLRLISRAVGSAELGRCVRRRISSGLVQQTNPSPPSAAPIPRSISQRTLRTSPSPSSTMPLSTARTIPRSAARRPKRASARRARARSCWRRATSTRVRRLPRFSTSRLPKERRLRQPLRLLQQAITPARSRGARQPPLVRISSRACCPCAARTPVPSRQHRQI